MACKRIRTFAVLVGALLLAGSGCNKNGGEAGAGGRPVPLPGKEQRLQFYFLFERTGTWGLPPVAAIRDALGARVDMNFFETDAQAEALLRSWSARPADLVLLGPGRPQALSQKLQLAKTDQRRILAVGLDPAVDLKALAGLLDRLCSRQLSLGKGCELLDLPPDLNANLPKGPLKVSFGSTSSEAQIWVGIEWVPWLQRLFQPNAAAAYRGEPKLLDFSEGLLSARINPSLPPTQANDLREVLQSWKLENL
jgi:hypothetical protein